MACLLPIIMDSSFGTMFFLVDGILIIDTASSVCASTVCGGWAQGSDNYLRQYPMNITLPQDTEGKGLAVLCTDKASFDSGNPAQETGRFTVSCH